jgi:hypothetical protein
VSRKWGAVVFTRREVLLEVDARKLRDHLLAQVFRDCLVSDAGHIKTNPIETPLLDAKACELDAHREAHVLCVVLLRPDHELVRPIRESLVEISWRDMAFGFAPDGDLSVWD